MNKINNQFNTFFSPFELLEVYITLLSRFKIYAIILINHINYKVSIGTSYYLLLFFIAFNLIF